MEMLIDALNTTDPALVAGAFGLMGTLLAGLLLIGALRFLLSVAGYYKMFQKAGIPGWKAFIPFYSDFLEYKICWDGKFFFLFAILYTLFTFLSNTTGTFAVLIGAIAGAIAIVIDIKHYIKLAKCYGKGTFFGLMLMIFPFICAPILGFGKAQYIGK